MLIVNKKYKLKINNTLFYIFSFIIFGFLSLLMIYSYFPEADTASSGGADLMFHANRLYALSEAMEFKMFPFYINMHTFEGYGYGCNLFYPDLMLYPFALLVKPFGLATTYKVLIFTHTLLCAIIAFFSIYKIFNSRAVAFLFSLLFTFSLYRIIDFSYRGALGEFIAFTFVPIVFLGIYEIIKGDHKKKWYIIALGFTGLIYSHLISSLLAFIAVIITVIIYNKTFRQEPKRLLYLVYAAVLSILLSAMFLFPMLEQFYYNEFNFQTFSTPNSIVNETVAFSHIVWGMFNGLTDNPLRIETIGIMLTIPLLFRFSIKESNSNIRIGDIFLICGSILLFAISDYCPWSTFPFNKLSIIQFPFRLLLFATLFWAISSAIYLVWTVHNNKLAYPLLFLVIVLTAYSIRLTGAVYQGYITHQITNSDGYNLDINEMVSAEFIPANIPYRLKRLGSFDIPIRQDYIFNRGNIITDHNSVLDIISERKNGKIDFTKRHNDPKFLIFPLLYYKGYKATVNDKETPVTQSSDGLVEINTSESGNVKVWYYGTTIQRVSFVISILSLIGLITYIIISRKKKLSI